MLLCDFMKGDRDWVQGSVRFSFQMIDVMIVGLIHWQYLDLLVPFVN